jgi:hypothetical protein
MSKGDEVRESELEKLRLQLAGCGVAAMQNTLETIKDRITPDNPYYSASYSDVCAAVDREISLRTKLEIYEKALEKCRSLTFQWVMAEKTVNCKHTYDEIESTVREALKVGK